ncbi:hypothetical protein QT711_11215 [Sporosarcina saromensis]|uniref:Uncharacterized protein n=1 Tax=Sporosarcina saromensis TaxID=359365 RepID=A0ABU4G9V9_9BACL|nr:hypothetical protein [Sporosarcina saromensis]MDW0113757.1 hypothetical protein [Sporosarcina saromensis]
MIIVIYDDLRNIVSVIKNVSGPIVNGNDITWEDGSLTGVQLPFLLLDDMEITEITNEIIAMDRKSEFPFVDFKKENGVLKQENEMNSMAIMELAELIIMGGV